MKIPTIPEGWDFFFSSLERAFVSKEIPEKYKAEILLNLLGDKASNIITHIEEKDLINYTKVKEIVLQEFQPTPYSCLEQFRKASRLQNETHVQFASRLTTSWNYYLKLRDVKDFESLNQLIISDKIDQTLDKETATHISVRQGDKWFKPSELGKEVDLFFTSKGKSFASCYNMVKFDLTILISFYKTVCLDFLRLITEETKLDNTLKPFWELENVEVAKKGSKESEFCEEHFKNNYTREDNGKYVVKMPFKEDPMCLGNSKQIALKKLNSLWIRLNKDENYLLLYSDFLREYGELGHMTEVKNEDDEQKGTYYISHLGIYRPEKSSTPLRVVFNASTTTSKGNSLNSIQCNGVIQEDLFSIMVRFRKHVYAFTADIKKIYRMISIDPTQRQLQRILWKESINGPVKTFELNTVTYGTVSAPFLAMRTLSQLAIDEFRNFPLAAAVLQSDFYMDDVLTGSSSFSSAKKLQQELIEILRSATMSLHKWCSNNPELAVNVDDEYTFRCANEVSVLRVSWKADKDCFNFKVKLEDECKITKRQVLSTIARIFDPLGLLGPVIAKEAIVIELHGFCDASELAYGAVVFCTSISQCGEVIIRLATSKSRVSPIKRGSIPRLELWAAVLLAKLMNRVISALKLNINNVFLWSDSMTVLSWLQKEPCCMKTFVANRVAVVQEMTDVRQWHVPSGENPADIISMGLDFIKLVQSELWWKGPGFLMKDEYPCKVIPTEVIVKDFADELKKLNDTRISLNIKVNYFLNEFLNLSNNYVKILRFLSFIYRFYNNCKAKNKISGPLRSEEIKHAELKLIKIIQEEEFKKELTSLQKDDKVVPNNENLGNYLSTEGIDWTFIPPRASNHGGLWEAVVKSVKHPLRRVVVNLRLTFEEFLTVITQIEGILNSCPLYSMSAELDDFDVLTPDHFLIGRPITALVKPSILNASDNMLKNWKKLTKVIQSIWKCWSNNYLSTLQQRNKWYYEKNNVEVGNMVILREDNALVGYGPLGRIIETLAGKDNKYYDENEDYGSAIIARVAAKHTTASEDQESDDDGAANKLAQVTTQDARKCIETLRRYFMQEGNEGSPIAALHVCGNFVHVQSVKRTHQITLDKFFKC
ncbi:hypothetical protein X975_18993, partial [Stegodyphus mimosarum]